MGEFYSGVNIVGMVKETIEVFFRLGPLHVNVVYETKPGMWLVRCRLYETSRNNISFLDTYITCENGIMSTDIYNKPTDRHQYLCSPVVYVYYCYCTFIN